jgi:hypothetical protein
MEFVPISFLNNLYSISEQGLIISQFKKIMKPSNDMGYLRYRFKVGGRVVRMPLHRVVAMVFIPNPENKPCVNHIDGNKLNNSISNLEWVTHRENSAHRFLSENKSSKHLGVSFVNGMNKFQVSIMVKSKKIYLGSYKSEIEAKMAYDIYVQQNSIKNKYIK